MDVKRLLLELCLHGKLAPWVNREQWLTEPGMARNLAKVFQIMTRLVLANPDELFVGISQIQEVAQQQPVF